MHKTLFPPMPQDEASEPAAPPKPQRLLGRVGQDKGAVHRASHTTLQPAPPEPAMRPQPVRRTARASIRPTPKRRTVHLTVWVKPGVKAELQRVAEQQGLSVSATGATLLEAALRQNLHIQHAALLQPIIEQAIRKQMRGISTRLAWLLVRVAFDVGQTRSLVTNLLGRQPGVSEDLL